VAVVLVEIILQVRLEVVEVVVVGMDHLLGLVQPVQTISVVVGVGEMVQARVAMAAQA
jgi:hypothetical protein